MYDYGGFTFEMPQQEYDIYSPATADVQQWQPSQDWQSQWSDMANWDSAMKGDWGFGGFGASAAQPQQGLVEEPQGPYGFNQALASEPAPPTVGQPGMGPKGQEDDLLTRLKKSGAGMGVGLLGQGASAGLQALMNPAQKSQKMPQLSVSSGQQYTPQALENTPGTKASPLISGRPTQVIGSQGLKGKRAPSYGGFSMY